MNQLMHRIILTTVLLISSKAFAAASFLGFSLGEDSAALMTLVTQSAQQLTALNNVAKMTSRLKEDIAFMRGVYSTADNLANQRWDRLTDEFVGQLMQMNPAIKTIYDNTAEIIQGRVQPNSQFKLLIHNGFEKFIQQSFPLYPHGAKGDQYAVSDWQNTSLNQIAERMMSDGLRRQREARMKAALNDCDGGLANCQKASTRMNVETVQVLDEIKTLQAQSAKAFATETTIQNIERKEVESAQQKQRQELLDAAKILQGKQTPLIFYNEKL